MTKRLNSFLPIFDGEFGVRLAERSEPMRQLLSLLEKRVVQAGRTPVVVEIGSVMLDHGWESHGGSTLVFDAFVAFHGGWLISVDHSLEVVRRARGLVSNRTVFLVGESTTALGALGAIGVASAVDLLYLDGAEWTDGTERTSGALRDLLASRFLGSDAIIACDDVYEDGFGGFEGSGGAVRTYFQRAGKRPLVDGRVCAWDASA